MRPAQDVKEALLGGNLELTVKKLPAKRSKMGTIEEDFSVIRFPRRGLRSATRRQPRIDTGIDKHRFQSVEHQ